MSSRAKRILSDSRFSRLEPRHAGAEGAVGLPVPVALRDLMDLADLMILVVLPGSADLMD